MATIGNNFVGLLDIYNRTDSMRQFVPIIEAMNTVNPLMDDAVTVQCNQGTDHLTTIRSDIGDATWGRLYQGIPHQKSTTQQVKDTTGFVERSSLVDMRLLDLYDNGGAIRLSEAQPALEAIAQEVQRGYFYYDTATTPERFKGLGPRYSTLTGGGTASQIVDAGGTGADNTSIWFVTWGEQHTALIYPKGTAAGIQRQDMGTQRVLDDLGNPYYAKEEIFRQHVGVTVKDHRVNARIANIDVSELRAGNVDIYKLMTAAYYKLHARRAMKLKNGGAAPVGRTVIYMNRDVMEAMDNLSTNNGSSDNYVRLTPMELQGKEILSWRGFPIRETDALINNEARVV